MSNYDLCIDVSLHGLVPCFSKSVLDVKLQALSNLFQGSV
jgi:hypothetical protein